MGGPATHSMFHKLGLESDIQTYTVNSLERVGSAVRITQRQVRVVLFVGWHLCSETSCKSSQS